MGIHDDVDVALHRAGVRYVVVGGTAVVLQGHVRLTIDLDLSSTSPPSRQRPR